MHSTDGPIESAMSQCPAGHYFCGAIESLTWNGTDEHDPGSAAVTSRAGRGARLPGGHPRRGPDGRLAGRRAVLAGERHRDQEHAGRGSRPTGGPVRIVATHIDNLIHAVGLTIDHGAGGSGFYVFDDGGRTAPPPAATAPVWRLPPARPARPARIR